MPLGFYLAQGLMPLGPSSSDDEEGPCTLPNGKIVCGPHGRVVCHKCCSDYSFMDTEDEDEDEEGPWKLPNGESVCGPHGLAICWKCLPYRSFVDTEVDDDVDENEGDGDAEIMHIQAPFSRNELRRGTGLVFPTKFSPPSPSITPLELFSGRKTHIAITRYTHRDDDMKVLIHTDGACANNGMSNPKAGWAFWHGLSLEGDRLVMSTRLEKKGPFDDDGIQSSNRAELRAVIAALRFRHWPGEGFDTFVVATDSEYVVKGSTEWARKWVKNDWKTVTGADVKNRDLWEALLGEAERWEDEGMALQFWRIPREWNTVADAAAKAASAEVDVPDLWMEIHGMSF